MPESSSGAGGRFLDGTSSGRPSAMSRRLLVPPWTSCAATFAPWRWTASVSRRRPGMLPSSDAAVWRRVERTGRVGDRHGPDDDEASTAAGPGLEPRHVGVADRAVGLAQVRAHRRHGDAVAQLERAEPPRRQQVLERRSHPWPSNEVRGMTVPASAPWCPEPRRRSKLGAWECPIRRPGAPNLPAVMVTTAGRRTGRCRAPSGRRAPSRAPRRCPSEPGRRRRRAARPTTCRARPS